MIAMTERNRDGYTSAQAKQIDTSPRFKRKSRHRLDRLIGSRFLLFHKTRLRGLLAAPILLTT
jgi:hypothetical protein